MRHDIDIIRNDNDEPDSILDFNREENANDQIGLNQADNNGETRSMMDESFEPTAFSTTQIEEIVENYDDEPDETVMERIYGLAEMFPEPVRDYAEKVTTFTKIAVCKFYSISCRVIWVVASSSVILFAPIAFESERAKIRESQKSHEKHLLLGPSAAMVSNPVEKPRP